MVAQTALVAFLRAINICSSLRANTVEREACVSVGFRGHVGLELQSCFPRDHFDYC